MLNFISAYVSPEIIAEFGADHIVVATGAKWRTRWRGPPPQQAHFYFRQIANPPPDILNGVRLTRERRSSFMMMTITWADDDVL
jgi:hypothetical protein